MFFLEGRDPCQSLPRQNATREGIRGFGQEKKIPKAVEIFPACDNDARGESVCVTHFRLRLSWTTHVTLSHLQLPQGAPSTTSHRTLRARHETQARAARRFVTFAAPLGSVAVAGRFLEGVVSPSAVGVADAGGGELPSSWGESAAAEADGDAEPDSGSLKAMAAVESTCIKNE